MLRFLLVEKQTSLYGTALIAELILLTYLHGMNYKVIQSEVTMDNG